MSGARRAQACAAIGLGRGTEQRWRREGGGVDRRLGPTRAANALNKSERQAVLKAANSAPYQHLSPKQIVPRLADEGRYLASESSFYRILRDQGQMTHRHRTRAPTHHRPSEHVATGPCQVWSWDITYLKSELRGSFYYLYLIEDVWSRKIVGFEVHERESMDLSSALITETCAAMAVDEGQLVLHSDNGGPMKGATMLATLQKLGVVASFSRPRVSDDNAYCESLFRTLKYRPSFPKKPFSDLQSVRAWVQGFVGWYNNEHRHSGIQYVTPSERHEGRDTELLKKRDDLYKAARAKHPNRWSGKTRNWQPTGHVLLNPRIAARNQRQPDKFEVAGQEAA